MKKHSITNALRITAIVLLFIVSLNALAAGYSFIVDPSGKGIGITTAYLRPSAPFRNYFIPGIVLFSVVGIGSSVIAVLAIIKQKHCRLLILMQGCILVGWIAVQLMMVASFHPPAPHHWYHRCHPDSNRMDVAQKPNTDEDSGCLKQNRAPDSIKLNKVM
jgi:hypothetical protein